MVLGGVAMGDTVVTLLPTMDAVTRITGSQNDWDKTLGGKNNSGTFTAVTATVIKKDLAHSAGQQMLETGWYWGLGDIKTNFTDSDEFAFGEDGFEFSGRAGYHGKFVVATIAVADLLKETESGDIVSSLTLSFDVAGAALGFSGWVYDGANVTELFASSQITSAESSSGVTANTFTKGNLSLDKEDTILFVFNQAEADNTARIISNITSSATISAIPEPTTATLSLLALAGLAVRRRRK